MAAHIVTQVVNRYPSIDWPDMDALRAYALAYDLVYQLKKARFDAAEIDEAEQQARTLWLELREAHHARRVTCVK